MASVTVRGVLLRSHDYSESSRILRFFTADRGVLSTMAKGARKSASKGSASLDTFASGGVTVYIKETRDLQTLKEFTVTRPRGALGRSPLRFGAASVLGEIVLRHGGEAPSTPVFDALEGGLDRLLETPDESVVPVLLARAWRLVTELGYRPVLEVCVACSTPLDESDEMSRFDFGAGGVRCSRCAGDQSGPRLGPGARRQVSALLAGGEGPLTRPRAHLQLLSDFVTYHVSGSRPLESFRFLTGLLPTGADRPDPTAGVGS